MTAAVPSRILFFDVDGCLVDSEEPILRAFNEMLGEYGFEALTVDELRPRVGPPLMAMLAALLAERDADPALAAPMAAAYRKRYAPLSIELARSFDGVPEVVEELGRTERLGVVTSKAAIYARPLLEALELAHHFEVIAGPGPDELDTKSVTLGGALEAMAPVELTASVMIGDRRHDIDAARAHGLRSIGVTWGFGTAAELRAAGADAVVGDARQLLDVLVAAPGGE